MQFHYAILAAAFFAVAQAHFQLQYPLPRGEFVEDDEPNFCDGYNTATSNRTTFPLTGGVLALNSEHASWSAGALLSTSSNPTSFDDFKIGGQDTYVVPFSKQSGEGVFCLPIDIQALGLSNLKDGANVTIQVVFSGGDGSLYQCADLTLSSNATVPTTSSLQCTNATSVPTASAVSAAPSSTATSPSSSGSATGSASASAPSTSSSQASSAGALAAAGISGIFGLAGAIVVAL